MAGGGEQGGTRQVWVEIQGGAQNTKTLMLGQSARIPILSIMHLILKRQGLPTEKRLKKTSWN